jgi:hypothetical protein
MPQSPHIMLISNIIDWPSSGFTIIQADYPIDNMNPMQHDSQYHILIIDQIYSPGMGDAIKKIASDDSRRYKI